MTSAEIYIYSDSGKSSCCQGNTIKFFFFQSFLNVTLTEDYEMLLLNRKILLGVESI